MNKLLLISISIILLISLFFGGYHLGYKDGMYNGFLNEFRNGGFEGTDDALIQKVWNLPYEMKWIPSTKEYGNGSYAVNYYGSYMYALLYDDKNSTLICINITRNNSIIGK